MESYGISDIGYVRSNNEDAWAELPHYKFFVLADGMGGHQAGEIASKEAVARLSDQIEDLYKGPFKGPVSPSVAQNLAAELQAAIERVNREVYLLSLKNERYAGMGTTLACLLIYGESLIYAHVGDSRIYRFRDKNLTKLTQDHSLRQELLFKGELKADSPRFNAFKNIITRAIGTHARVQPEVECSHLAPGDIYFLCSDGLTDELSLEEMRSILLKAKTIKEASDTLVAQAKAKGGNDNITVVMVQIRAHEKDLPRQQCYDRA